MNNFIQLFGQFCLSETMQHQGSWEKILTIEICISRFFFLFFLAFMTELLVFEKGAESKIKESPFKELSFASKQVAVAQGVWKWHRNEYE